MNYINACQAFALLCITVLSAWAAGQPPVAVPTSSATALMTPMQSQQSSGEVLYCAGDDNNDTGREKFVYTGEGEDPLMQFLWAKGFYGNDPVEPEFGCVVRQNIGTEQDPEWIILLDMMIKRQGENETTSSTLDNSEFVYVAFEGPAEYAARALDEGEDFMGNRTQDDLDTRPRVKAQRAKATGQGTIYIVRRMPGLNKDRVYLLTQYEGSEYALKIVRHSWPGFETDMTDLSTYVDVSVISGQSNATPLPISAEDWNNFIDKVLLVAIEEELPTPGYAIVPVPADEADDASITPTLGWTNGGVSGASYDVYFGTNPTLNQSDNRGNHAAPQYVPGTLQRNTTYYWRIDTVTGNETIEGRVWSFTTEP